MLDFDVRRGHPCPYNREGVDCEETRCQITCGWRPQIDKIRRRQINNGAGLVTGENGLRYLPVRTVRRK